MQRYRLGAVVGITFLFLSTSVLQAQTELLAKAETSSKVVTIIEGPPSDDCLGRAVSITDEEIGFDHCLESASGFSKDFDYHLSIVPQGQTIFRNGLKDWMQINQSLQTIDTCDTLLPFLVTVHDQEVSRTFSLRRVQNCYPESCREVMESLEHLFQDPASK